MANAVSAAEAAEEHVTPAEAALWRAAQHAALGRRAKHHAMLAALSGTAPAFPAAAQLASRWVSAHMLSNHITEPMSELLTAAGFSAGRAAVIPGKRPIQPASHEPLYLPRLMCHLESAEPRRSCIVSSLAYRASVLCLLPFLQ